MDKVIFKFLKTEIETYFLDFRQEDLNTNFFKGNVELSNLRLNTSVLQEALSTVVPYIEVESATVEKFRLKVPFSALKTKPTEVWISKIDIKCREPQRYLEFQSALKKNIEEKQQATPKTGKYEYTLVDRILDGVQVTIDHIHVSFALLGPFKYAKPGLWTPHVADIHIYDLQVYSVDENWKRVPIQDTRSFTHGKPHVWHFKESACRLSVRLVPPRDSTGASIPMEPVIILDRLPVKFRLTQQRLNINETFGMEMVLVLDEAKMSYTPYELGHLMYWVDALSSAAFRQDLKHDVDKNTLRSTLLIAKPNTLFTILLNKLSIQLRERDRPTARNLEFELQELQINRILQTSKPGETMTRLLLSQILLRNLKQDSILMQLYFSNPNETQGKHLYATIPDQVRLHPDQVAEPTVLRYCQTLVVRYPEPDPPTAAFEYTVNTDSFQIIMERDGIESLGIFLLHAHLVNVNRTKPTEEDYKGSIQRDIIDPTADRIECKEDGVEFFERDLLANATALIGLDCKMQEFSIKIPTPGGGLKPYLELRFDGVSLLGTPSTAPAVYKRDFLDLRSNNGTNLVMPHDFYFQKFNIEKGIVPVEFTFKFNAQINSISMNMYEKDGSPKESICTITNIHSFSKIYSRARHIPNRLTIPQVESSVVVGDVTIRLVQKHHHMLVDFLSEHFLYGATSLIKQMLEQEIRSLAVEERKFARAQEDPSQRRKFLLLPSYMVSSAIENFHVAFVDDNSREVLTLSISATECIIEKHDDRQILIARVGDLRLHSLFPELENSIIWVKKNKLPNIAQFRTELRKLREGNPLIQQNQNQNQKQQQITKSFILGDIEGLRINFDIRTLYNIQDYLADILGESIILIEKTQNSHYWWKIIRYIDILYVTGIPSEANYYWRNLREIKLFLEQFSDLFDDITWDLSILDVHLFLGDDSIQVEPFSMEEFRIVREQEDTKDSVMWSLKKVKGSLWTKEGDKKTENVLCLPVDTSCLFQRKKNLEWTPQSPSDVQKWFQEVHFLSNPSPQIIVKPEHFYYLGLLFDRHLPRFIKFLNELMLHADSSELRRISQRTTIVFDEDVLDEARSTAARAYSAETVKSMRQELDRSKKDLEDALTVQNDIAAKYAELQVQHFELTKKMEDVERTAGGYETAMMEMQGKIMELQLKLANQK